MARQSMLSKIKIIEEMYAESSNLIGKLRDERDGLTMRLEALMANLNAQAKRIEILTKESKRNQYKAQAYQEVMREIIGIKNDREQLSEV